MKQNQNNKLFSLDNNQADTYFKEGTNINYENKPIDIESSNNITKESEKKTLFGDVLKKSEVYEYKSLFDNNQSLFGNYAKNEDKNKNEEKSENKSLFNEQEKYDFFKNSTIFGRNTNLFGEKIDTSTNQKDDFIMNNNIDIKGSDSKSDFSYSDIDSNENEINIYTFDKCTLINNDNKNINPILRPTYSESSSDKNEDENEEDKDKGKKETVIEFSEKFKNTNNLLSINYNTKKTKLDINSESKIKYDNIFFELKN